MKYLGLVTSMMVALSSMHAMADEAVIWLTQEQSQSGDIALLVDDVKQSFDKNGYVIVNLPMGEHVVKVLKNGVELNSFMVPSEANKKNEIQIAVIGNEVKYAIKTYADNTDLQGKITGVITASESGKPLANARINIKQANYTTQTDANGKFVLSLPVGVYNIEITHDKYGKKITKNLRVLSDSSSSIKAALVLADSTGEEMISTGDALVELIETKRDSTAILDSISTAEIAKTGDSDAGSAIKRVSGVSLVGGQYAVVRGLGGRYISSQLNSGSIPSTNPLSRDIALDMFPASMLEGIEIHKSFTPNLPGDSTGGSINLVTKGMPTERIAKITVGTGFRTGVTGKDVISYEGSNTDVLGFDDGLRAMPDELDSATDFGQNSFNVCNDPSICITPAAASNLAKSLENNYNTEHKKAAPDAEFSLSYGDIKEFDNAGSLAYYSDVGYKNKWSARQDAEIHDNSGDFSYERTKRNVDVNAYGLLGYTDADATYELVSKTIVLRKSDDTTKEVKGTDGEGTDIQEVTLQWVERTYLGQVLEGKHHFNDNVHEIDWSLNLGQSIVYEPDRRNYQYRNGVIFPSTLERRFTDQNEGTVDVSVDYIFNWDISTDITAKLISGIDLTSRNRDTNIGRFGIRQDSSVNAGTLNLEQLLTPANFDNGNFTLIVKTASTDSYKAKEDITALYFKSETTFFEQVILMAGVRFEDAKQELTYELAPRSNDTYQTNEILPSIALTWKVDDEWQLRAGYSKTLSRPGLTERSLSSQYDPETDEQVFGNNALILSTIDNIDVRAEYYFNDVDSASIGLFTKMIDKPIERTVPDASGSAANGYTFVNQDKAVISGIELDLRKTLVEFEEYTTYMATNMSYMDSKVTLAGRSIVLEGQAERKLQGQSDVLANVQFGLDQMDGIHAFTVVMNYFDDRITKAGRPGQAVIEEGRVTVDMVYKYQISESMKLGAKVQNLFNQKVSYSILDQASEFYKEGTYFNVNLAIDF